MLVMIFLNRVVETLDAVSFVQLMVRISKFTWSAEKRFELQSTTEADWAARIPGNFRLGPALCLIT